MAARDDYPPIVLSEPFAETRTALQRQRMIQEIDRLRAENNGLRRELMMAGRALLRIATRSDRNSMAVHVQMLGNTQRDEG